MIPFAELRLVKADSDVSPNEINVPSPIYMEEHVARVLEEASVALLSIRNEYSFQDVKTKIWDELSDLQEWLIKSKNTRTLQGQHELMKNMVEYIHNSLGWLSNLTWKKLEASADIANMFKDLALRIRSDSVRQEQIPYKITNKTPQEHSKRRWEGLDTAQIIKKLREEEKMEWDHIAEFLNKKGIEPARGGLWYKSKVRNVYVRLKDVPREVLEDRA